MKFQKHTLVEDPVDYSDREFWTDKRFAEQEEALERNLKNAQRDLNEVREVRAARKRERELELKTAAATAA